MSTQTQTLNRSEASNSSSSNSGARLRPSSQLNSSSSSIPPTGSSALKGPLRSDGRGFPVPLSSLSSSSSSSSPRFFTWEDVACHTSESSCWIYIETKVYDITPWLASHPGGKSVLLLAAGRDCTDLFTSYHPFSARAPSLLSRFYIGELTVSEFPQYESDSGFYSECRKEVADYFQRTGKDPKDLTPGLTRLAGIFAVAALSYGSIVAGQDSFPLWFRFLAAVIFGICQALPLLHCMHDASHTAIGHSPWHWSLIGRGTMDWFAGASLNSWHNQHIVGHHVYTNVMGVDPDLPEKPSGDIRRVSKRQAWAPLYQFQHIYLLVLYGFLAIKFRIQDILCTLVDQSNGAIRVNPLGSSEVISQLITKTFWVTWRFVLPLYFFPSLFNSQFLLLTLVMEMMTGYFLTFNFQVSHVSPVALFPEVGEKSVFDQEWAIAQLESTIDYAHGDSICTFLCGALNYQSVHHLFPCVSQYHYPALAPIIKGIAKKHGVRYNYVKSFWEAFSLHMKHLREMGVQEIHHY